MTSILRLRVWYSFLQLDRLAEEVKEITRAQPFVRKKGTYTE